MFWWKQSFVFPHPELNCFSIESTCYNQFGFLPIQHFTVLLFFRSFPDTKIEDVFIGPGVSGLHLDVGSFRRIFFLDNKLSGWDERNSLFVLFQFGERKNWNFVIWMKRLETTRRKQKTSAGGSEFKMRNCCKRIELHIKRRQKITRRRNLNNFYMRLEGYHEEASVSFNERCNFKSWMTCVIIFGLNVDFHLSLTHATKMLSYTRSPAYTDINIYGEL